MKNSLSLVTLLFIFACSTSPYKTMEQEVLRLAVPDSSACSWEIEQEDILDLMFLEVPYQRKDYSSNVGSLTFSLSKYKSQDRPNWISMALSSEIVQHEGLFLYFKKSPPNSQIRPVDDPTLMPIRINLEMSSHETLTAYMTDGFALDEKQHKVDIFQRFLEYDILYLMFFLPEGGHQTISVPLNHFKKQYRDLVKETTFTNQ